MARILLFLFPALLDLVFGASRFVCVQRMGNNADSSNLAVSMVLVMFALGYLVSAKSCGFFVNARNAARLLVASCMSLGILSLLLMYFNALFPIYPLMLMFGVSLALFFVPFQVFMKSVSSEDGSGMVRSTSLYTGSWSMGIAAGPFVSGYLWENFGWQWCYVICALVAFGCAIGIYLFARMVGHRTRENLEAAAMAHQDAGRGPSNPYSAMPDLARMGWLCSSAGFLAMLLLIGVLPKYLASLGIGEDIKGFVLGQASLAQSLTAFAMIGSRTWMYRPVPILLFGGIGAGSMVVFAISDTPLGLIIASSMFGVYAAMYCMSFVFYSLVHPTKSASYLSTNETIVGCMSMAGPLLGGYVADRLNASAAFALAGSLIAIAIIYHAYTLHKRCGHRLAELHA